MKKYITLIILAIFSITSLFATPDIGIRLGHGSFIGDPSYESGLHGLTGVNVGLTNKMELNLEAIFNIVPKPMSNFVVGGELTYSFLNRVRQGRSSGSSMNASVSLGLFCGPLSNDTYGLKYLTMRVIPISIGNPAQLFRESLFPMGIAYNIDDKKFSFFFSIGFFDTYLTRTWVTDYK